MTSNQQGSTAEAGDAVDASPTFSAVVESSGEGQIVLRLPKSNYQLHLATDRTFAAGQRVRGIVRGESLRMYPAHGGGKYIEPVWGHPRIVSGVVLGADPQSRTAIIDAVAIFHLAVPANQNFDVLAPGALVNFYIKSGARFEPVE